MYTYDIDVHLIFCVDLDLHIPSFRGRVLLGFSSSILTDGYKLACIYCKCPHDIHVHLFCFDLHKFLLRLRAATCPITLNYKHETSLFRQELVFFYFEHQHSYIFILLFSYVGGVFFIPCINEPWALYYYLFGCCLNLLNIERYPFTYCIFHVLLTKHALLYFLRTVQVRVPCYGGVLYGF